MWFFGLSTQDPRNLWIIGAITLVIFLTIVIKKCLILLEAKRVSQNKETSDDIEKCNSSSTSPKHTTKGHVGGTKNCFHCCSGAIRTYALEELKMATSDFRIQIGVGATADVYLAELGDGRFGAVKRVMEARGGSKKVFLDEVSVLLRISHPNLVGLLGFCLEKGEQLLLLEYVPNKSLFDRLHTRYGQTMGVLSWSSRLSIARDVAKALDYLHCVADPLVIHRDVKSSNILLLDDNHAKLADFGLCKLGQDAQTALTPTTIKGSLGYVDVHYLNTGMVSTKSDVYSFGVLLLELITGLKSFQGSVTLPEWTEESRKSDNMEVLVGMVDPKVKGEVDLEQLRGIVDVANLALLVDAEARPDITQILYRVSNCIEVKRETDLPPV